MSDWWNPTPLPIDTTGQWTPGTVDISTLPAALLDQAKVHMRIDFTDDDDYVKSCLARAIDIAERKFGSRINPVPVDWWPPLEQGLSSYQTPAPVQPVAGFTVLLTGGVDVSAEYSLRGTGDLAPVWLTHNDGTAFPLDADISLTSGYASATTLPLAYLDPVLRISAKLYELREDTAIGVSTDFVPGWIDDLLVGTWVPRC